MIAIKTTGNWRMYWGPAPLPQNSKACGTVRRASGDEGALIQMGTGIYVQGNACSIRSLPQRDIIIALHQAEIGALGGASKSEAKVTAVRENGKLGGRPKMRRKR